MSLESALVLFRKPHIKGRVDILHGTLERLEPDPEGAASGNSFEFTKEGARLLIFVRDAVVGKGSGATIVTIRTDADAFSFFLRDINSSNPVYIPEYGVIVTAQDDTRSFDAVEEAILSRKLQSDFDRFEKESEESYATAATANHHQYHPTWLGLGYDLRIFQVGKLERLDFLGEVQMRFHSNHSVPWRMAFFAGQGSSCQVKLKRWLEDGGLPILHAEQVEGEVVYHMTAFATLEKGPVSPARVRGSDWLASYTQTAGHMLKEEEIAPLRDLIEKETTGREEEMICCVRLEAANHGKVPRYAFFKAPVPCERSPRSLTTLQVCDEALAAPIFDPRTGRSVLADRGILSVTRLNDKPLMDEEISVLLQPGESIRIDMLIPHSPLPVERAGNLDAVRVEEHLEACRAYWRQRMKQGAEISVPEKPIHESIQAGLPHLDIATIGKATEGPLLATIGFYTPIGSESAPIIQYYDSLGLHQTAERCIDFFLARQKDNGFIQNFRRYELETGPVLWTMGEHYRYTRDRVWAERVVPRMLKSCDYLLQWRARNKREEYREKGYYGMIEGKVADPEDFYHSFMLNGLSYLGLKRALEILKDFQPAKAGEMEQEIEAFREDIRAGFYFAMANAPVVPVGDGSWAPFMPAWVESSGAGPLYATGAPCFTHGTFFCRDNLIGPLYLVIGEVLEPGEIGATFLLKSNQYPVTEQNAALSQPYYCRHDFVHLRRGETKAYLKAYYNQLTASHDPETYSVWEHYFGTSQHKTHEEAWFLMQTRWMLYLENGDTLEILKVAPRQWLEDGKTISVRNAASYFGRISFEVRSALSAGVIEAEISCEAGRAPKQVRLRLPHPERRKATQWEGGTYDPETETVGISDFNGHASVRVFFR